MIIGGLSVYLRAVPLRIWNWGVNQTTLALKVNDDDDAFTWVKEWFLEQKFLKRIRRLDLGACSHAVTERAQRIPWGMP